MAKEPPTRLEETRDMLDRALANIHDEIRERVRDGNELNLDTVRHHLTDALGTVARFVRTGLDADSDIPF